MILQNIVAIQFDDIEDDSFLDEIDFVELIGLLEEIEIDLYYINYELKTIFVAKEDLEKVIKNINKFISEIIGRPYEFKMEN